MVSNSWFLRSECVLYSLPIRIHYSWNSINNSKQTLLFPHNSIPHYFHRPSCQLPAAWWHAGLGSAARGGWASGTRAGRLRTSSVGFGPPARTSVDQAPQLERRRPGRGRANVMRASGAQRAKRGGAGPGPAGSGQTERARAAHGLHAVRGLRARGLRRAGCGACAAAHLCFAERSSCRCALSERTPPRRQPAAVAQYAGGVAPFAPSSPSR